MARLSADSWRRLATDLFSAAHQMLEPSHWNAVDAAVLEYAARG